MDFVMNEKKYALDILTGERPVKENNRLYAITAIAKYYRSIGYDGDKLKCAVNDFAESKFRNAPQKTVRVWVDRSVKTSKKHSLLEIDGIDVTEKELELIKSLHSDRFKSENIQKLAFTFLCLAKFEAAKGRKDGWVNTARKHIFKSAGLKNLKSEKQLLYIHELYELGYVDISLKICGGGIKVLGIKDGNITITVDNINETGYIFDEYNGKRFTRCKICQSRIPITNGRNMYCRDCAEKINREKTRERMKSLKL